MQQPPQYTITTSQPGTVNITANAPPFQYNPYPNAAAAAPHTANASKFTGDCWLHVCGNIWFCSVEVGATKSGLWNSPASSILYNLGFIIDHEAREIMYLVLPLKASRPLIGPKFGRYAALPSSSMLPCELMDV